MSSPEGCVWTHARFAGLVLVAAVLVAGCASVARVDSLLVIHPAREAPGTIALRYVKPLADGTVLMVGTVDGRFMIRGQAHSCGPNGNVFIARADLEANFRFFRCARADDAYPYVAASEDRLYVASRVDDGATFDDATVWRAFPKVERRPSADDEPYPGELVVFTLDFDGNPLDRVVVTTGFAFFDGIAVANDGTIALTTSGGSPVPNPPADLRGKFLVATSLIREGRAEAIEVVEAPSIDGSGLRLRALTPLARGGFLEAAMSDAVTLRVRAFDRGGGVQWSWSRATALETDLRAWAPLEIRAAPTADGGALVGVSLQADPHARIRFHRYAEDGQLRHANSLSVRDVNLHLFGVAELGQGEYVALTQIYGGSSPIVHFGVGAVAVESSAVVLLGFEEGAPLPVSQASFAAAYPGADVYGFSLTTGPGESLLAGGSFHGAVRGLGSPTWGEARGLGLWLARVVRD